MAVPLINDGSLDAWQQELDEFVLVLEYLEEANKICKNLAQGRNAADTIAIAINDVNIVAGKAALKVGRLRRALATQESIDNSIGGNDGAN